MAIAISDGCCCSQNVRHQRTSGSRKRPSKRKAKKSGATKSKKRTKGKGKGKKRTKGKGKSKKGKSKRKFIGPTLPKGHRRGFVGPLTLPDTLYGEGNRDAYRDWLNNQPEPLFHPGRATQPAPKRSRQTEPKVEVDMATYSAIMGSSAMQIEDTD